MDERQTSPMVIVPIDSRDREEFYSDLCSRFPVTGAAAVVYKDPAKMQFAGVYETVRLVIDAQLIHWLLGGGAVVGAAALAKIGQLAAEDFYKWFKCFFSKSVERDLVSPGHEKNGVRLAVSCTTEQESPCQVFWITHHHSGVPPEPESELEKLCERVSATFYPYESVICPLVLYLADKGLFLDCLVQADIGPTVSHPEWTIVVSLQNCNESSFSLSVSPRGGISLFGPAGEFQNDLLRDFLSANPPFVEDLTGSVMHWKTCESMATRSSTDLRPGSERSQEATRCAHCLETD